jgi:hypothetical protein
MKANLQKATFVALALSGLLLGGCSSTPFYGEQDQAKITIIRDADGSTRSECLAQGRGVNTCPDQTIMDMSTSGHSSTYAPADAEANALKAYCRTYPEHAKCKE